MPSSNLLHYNLGVQGPSQTALQTAAGRALHLEGAGPHVLDDWLALDLAGRATLERMRAEMEPAHIESFGNWVSVRARYVEDEVERAMASGISQYVLLGAGLDSFAYRRHELMTNLSVYEVDHPESQAWKRSRLHGLGIDMPSSLVFVPVNFETDSLEDRLSAAGLDFEKAAIFSWIGVTMYLTLDGIEATLKSIAASAPGTRLVLTYDQPRETLDAEGQRSYDRVSKRAAANGEPFVTLFRPSDIEKLLSDLGFRSVGHFGRDEARRTYFDGKEARMTTVQRLATAER